MDGKYYHAYEARYQAVQQVPGDFFWGHAPGDQEMREYLADWIGKHALAGKTVVEYCCGEGGGGVALCDLGCNYQGYDVAPSAVRKAASLLSGFAQASVCVRDLVGNPPPENSFDAAFDSMGLHMIVVDSDRSAYLSGMCRALKPGAPAFFFHQSYRENAYEGPVASFDDWKRISGSDYSTPQTREIGDTGVTVEIPLVPARARTKAGYLADLKSAGFVVDEIIEMGENTKCIFSVSIFAHKPGTSEEI